MASDKAKRETNKLIDKLEAAGIPVQRIPLPSRRDLDQLMRDHRDQLLKLSA